MVTAAKGKAGGTVSIGATSATLPTSTAGTTTGFESLGYTSEDGITRAISKDTNLVKDHHGSIVAALEGGKTETFQFKCIDATNLKAMGLTFGEATGTLETGITVKSNSNNTGRHAFIFDEVLSDNSLHRIVVPDAVVTNIGNIVYKGTEVVAYDLTITAIEDASGNTAYDYYKSAT